MTQSTQSSSLPVVPMRNAVLFPGVTFPISAGRAGTLRGIEAAMNTPERLVFAVAQRSDSETVSPTELYTIGTIATLGSIQRGIGGIRLVLEGKSRGIALRVAPEERLPRGDRPARAGDAPARREGRGLRRPPPRGARARRRARPEARPARRDRRPDPRGSGRARAPGRPRRRIPGHPGRRQAGPARDALGRRSPPPRARARAAPGRRPLGAGRHPVQGQGRDRQPPARDVPARADEGDPEGAR